MKMRHTYTYESTKLVSWINTCYEIEITEVDQCTKNSQTIPTKINKIMIYLWIKSSTHNIYLHNVYYIISGWHLHIIYTYVKNFQQ